MSKEKKHGRMIRKQFKVFCEGDTEYNYFEMFRKDKKLSLSLKPINMEGGGYTNFLNQLKTDGNTNCLAKFIIVDGDKAYSDDGEKKKLMQLIEFCCIQNKNERIPHILIINYPNFEYMACLHSVNYKRQDVKRFIIDEYGYSDIDAFKADERVYYFLNSNGNSYNVMLKNVNKNNAIIKNEISLKKSIYEISVVLKYDFDKLGIKGSNIQDFFEVIGKYEPSINSQ